MAEAPSRRVVESSSRCPATRRDSANPGPEVHEKRPSPLPLEGLGEMAAPQKRRARACRRHGPASGPSRSRRHASASALPPAVQFIPRLVTPHPPPPQLAPPRRRQRWPASATRPKNPPPPTHTHTLPCPPSGCPFADTHWRPRHWQTLPLSGSESMRARAAEHVMPGPSRVEMPRRAAVRRARLGVRASAAGRAFVPSRV